MEPVWDDAYLAHSSGQSQEYQVDPKFPIFGDAKMILSAAVRVCKQKTGVIIMI